MTHAGYFICRYEKVGCSWFGAPFGLFALEVVNGDHAQKFSHLLLLKGLEARIGLTACLIAFLGGILKVASFFRKYFLVPFAENDFEVVDGLTPNKHKGYLASRPLRLTQAVNRETSS